jgi:hypothetical protein
MPKIELGTDFNHYEEVTVSGASEFPDDAQVEIRFRGPQRLMFICTSGSPEYSFNGNTVHGVMSTSAPQNFFNFGPRDNKKIWFKGTGTVRVHAWQSHR